MPGNAIFYYLPLSSKIFKTCHNDPAPQIVRTEAAAQGHLSLSVLGTAIWTRLTKPLSNWTGL